MNCYPLETGWPLTGGRGSNGNFTQFCSALAHDWRQLLSLFTCKKYTKVKKWLPSPHLWQQWQVMWLQSHLHCSQKYNFGIWTPPRQQMRTWPYFADKWTGSILSLPQSRDSSLVSSAPLTMLDDTCMELSLTKYQLVIFLCDLNWPLASFGFYC